MQVPLVLTPFWVQIHDVPIGLFSENLAINLGNFLGNFMEYDVSNIGKEYKNFMRIRAQVDIRRPLKRKKLIEFRGRKSYVFFKYERLTLFCFYCGKLGHNDSFCEAKMLIGVEVANMGWDLSTRAQSRRTLTMNSVWQREDGEGITGGIQEGNRRVAREPQRMKHMKSFGKTVDPVLGFNLEGSFLCDGAKQGRPLTDQAHDAMDHDLKDAALAGEEGEKRSREENDVVLTNEGIISPKRSRRLIDLNHLTLTAAKRQADRAL